MAKTVTLTHEDMNRLFEYRAAGENNGIDWDEYWWIVAGEGGEGYYMIWADGTIHHTYRNPAELFI